MISRSLIAFCRLVTSPVEPVPQRRPLVSVFYAEYLECRVVQLAAVVERELFIQVTFGVSHGHSLAGRDGPCRGFRRCLPNVGDEHHVHVDDFRLQVALDAGGSAELVLGEYGYSAVEPCPQQIQQGIVEWPNVIQVTVHSQPVSIQRYNMPILLRLGPYDGGTVRLRLQSQVVPGTGEGATGDRGSGVPALAFGVCDVLRKVGPPEPRPWNGRIDYHASHVTLADYGTPDLHQCVKLGFEETPLDKVLHFHAVAHYADAPGVLVRDPPAVTELLRVRRVFEMLLRNVAHAEKLVGAAGEASADLSQLLKRGHVAPGAFY